MENNPDHCQVVSNEARLNTTTMKKNNPHYKKSTVLINGITYFMGSGVISKNEMKETHFIGIDFHTKKEHIVSLSNGLAFELLN